MRTTDERVAAVKRRVAELEHARHVRRQRLLALASVAASLAVIVGLALAMPRLSGAWQSTAGVRFATAASLFSGSAATGYILIGLLAFVLGVGVTILCFRLKAPQKSDRETETDDGRVH